LSGWSGGGPPAPFLLRMCRFGVPRPIAKRRAGPCIIAMMPLHELHPLTDAEIARLPQKPGIFILFQVQIPRHADAARNLRQGLRAARKSFPRATHFGVEIPAAEDEEAAAARGRRGAARQATTPRGTTRSTGSGRGTTRAAPSQRAMAQRAIAARVRQIKKELSRVRAATFVGRFAAPER
jgi:hypothetical protein